MHFFSFLNVKNEEKLRDQRIRISPDENRFSYIVVCPTGRFDRFVCEILS